MYPFKRPPAQPLDTFVFPAGPPFVPEGLTTATPKYKRHATIAMLSLAGFVLFYLALMLWFGWTAYAIFSNLKHEDENGVYIAIAGACSAFLALFMAKGLVFVQKNTASRDLELKATDHPRLFHFLHVIAKEAGAPKPHRVFVSAAVNAAVFYDLTLLDLLFPSKKNLEIGLGLVNVLSLGELKAVLAHEFGHFAQKSMAVGRWVYVAQQVATQIVNKRDALDSFLAGLSRIDLRIAWIGWILQFIVWSLRSLIDTLLMGVILAQRALSREMEFQADLVSVSLCGSEALITALHKLSGADDAMQRAMNFAASENISGQPVNDIFSVQSRILTHLQSIYSDPHYGTNPEPPAGSPHTHRVFKSSIAAPPRMWATHPASSDREDNAKEVFVKCDPDERSAWELFPDAGALRTKLTAQVFPAPEAKPDSPAPASAPLNETLTRLDTMYASITVNPRYRGAYLGRSIARAFRDAGDMYTPVPSETNLAHAIGALYAPSFGDTLEKLRELFDEKGTFEGLQKGYLQAPGGVLRWRGEEVAPRELPKILKSLDQEIDPLKEQIKSHDQQIRSLHLAAAASVGKNWDAYLRGLTDLIHYAEHWHADLNDLAGILQNVYAVVTADGKVSKKELQRLVATSTELHAGLDRFYAQAGGVRLDARIAERTGISSFAEALGELKLPEPTSENIGPWLGAVDGWVGAVNGTLGACRNAALRELLSCEDQVAAWLAAPATATHAPAATSLPADYPRLMIDEFRPRQTKLRWWDRFQTADGWLAASARFLVAFAVVSGVIILGAVLAFRPTPSETPSPVLDYQYYPPDDPK